MSEKYQLINTIYAFVGWISTYTVLICFLAWAFLPSSVLDAIGMTYYPSRYYAVAIPAYLVFLYFFLSFVYMSYNLFLTPDPDDMTTVREKGSKVPLVKARYVRCGEREGIPEYGDMDPVDLYQQIIK